MKNKIAAIQMCSSHILDENLQTAGMLIEEASANGAKLIVLPEMFPMMGQTAEEKIVLKETLGHGQIQNFLSEQSRKNKVWIVAGTIPLASIDENKIKAACLLLNDKGEVVARYDKIHLFDVTISETEEYKESNTTAPGTQFTVADTPFGKIGLAVCYDIRFPELFRYLFQQGAEIFAVPAAFTIPTGAAHWELLARSRAVENFCYFIGACQGGRHSNGRETYGNSLIIDPWGKVLAKQESINPGIIYADIDLNKIQEIRRAIPIASHQKIFIDIK
jgi:nitrilase